MKYTTDTTSAMFSEQIHTVLELFEKWNDCERVVTIYALLKQIPFACLKFIQYAIEVNLAQSYSLEQAQIIETNANSAQFLTNLSETYKNFKCNDVQLNKDSIFFEADHCKMHHKLEKFYDKKEDILKDILKHIAILRPGNDDAKAAYLELIPMAVDDAIRGYVNTALVQQIFSFMLIHPAFSPEDRRSLSKFLRHLENHIISKESNFLIYTNRSSPTNEQPHSSSSSSWQAIAPPQSKSNETISWDSTHHLTQPTQFGDDASKELRKTVVGNLIDFPSAPPSSSNMSCLYDTSTDDHHESFSKNGTEIEFDGEDTDKSNTQIGFDTLAHLSEFLTVPGLLDNITLKTRRSNSLTTTGTSSQNACSSSAQNLANISQKPRSFSLSMVSPRSSLTSSGSDTRLDDFKPKYTKFSSHNIGMGNIGQWLKSLRLHKYVWLFSNITYDQMMDITEEYLQNLNVTKGARHKLVLCIQKLKERHSTLVQIEKDLLTNKTTFSGVLDELTNIVLSPIKPVDTFNKKDVGAQFLKVLNLVSTMITTKHIVPQDEEIVNSLLWILEKAVHNEAFVAHTNQLKEYRFKVSRIKVHFPPKGHFGKNSSSNNGNISRTRSFSQNHGPIDQNVQKIQNNYRKRTNSSNVPPTETVTTNCFQYYIDLALPTAESHKPQIPPIQQQSGFGIGNAQVPTGNKNNNFHNDNNQSISASTSIDVTSQNTQTVPNDALKFQENSENTHTISANLQHQSMDQSHLSPSITETDLSNIANQIQFGSISNLFLANPDLFKVRPLPTPIGPANKPNSITNTVKNKMTTNNTNTQANPTIKPIDPVNVPTTSLPQCPSKKVIQGDIQKPTYSQITTSGLGMGNMPVWLKSLRLHKYTWVFTNMTYDQMMNISEPYLISLNITKGARDKLLICIAKLKDRFTYLCQLERDLLHQLNMGGAPNGTLNNVLDELLKLVLTPMKPIQLHDKIDLGSQLLKVLNLVSQLISSKHDQDLAKFLQILDRAVNSEAFVAHISHITKMKSKF